MSVLLDAALVLGAGASTAVAGYAVGVRRRTAGRATPDAWPSGDQVPHVPADVLRVLALGRAEWIILDRSDRVVRHSDGVEALGLVRGVELRHDELRTLVRRVRRERGPLERDLDVPRGPVPTARLDLRVCVAVLSDGLVVVLVEDLTQARRIEETRRDFVANVSHELKTPVGGLRLLAEAVEDAADDPETVARFSARMKIESVRLANLVQEIVDLSRLQGSDTIASARPVDLGDCARLAVDEVHLIAEGRDIEIVARDDAAEHEVLGDAGLLTTAVRNLVSNAVNYSESGTRVVVDIARDDEDVVVRVSDEGVGLFAPDLERIFERFYRVDPARSRKTGGTGLGLAIVKHVCANHGGQVQVWSEPGVGSTFEIQIPARSTTVADDSVGTSGSSRFHHPERKETP